VRPRTRTAELAALVDRLPAKERRGSRPRCVLLTHGTVQRVSDRLTELASPALVVNSDDAWAPRGFDAADEITLGRCPDALLGKREQDKLARWWLATGGRLPTWDLVASGRADGRKGILLVEAKAHDQELSQRRGRKISPENDVSITRALHEATLALDAVIPGWDLANAPYQLANRIAWSWKLASMGIPVVLVYLGFLHATEMSDRGEWFLDRAQWEGVVRRHSIRGVPAEVWSKRIDFGDAWLQLEIRATHVPLPTPCPSCGGQLRWILYGMPTDAASAAVDDGGFILGGCCIGDDSPTHECEQCGVGVRVARDHRLDARGQSIR
jgi:hypothetical protein